MQNCNEHKIIQVRRTGSLHIERDRGCTVVPGADCCDRVAWAMETHRSRDGRSCLGPGRVGGEDDVVEHILQAPFYAVRETLPAGAPGRVMSSRPASKNVQLPESVKISSCAVSV